MLKKAVTRFTISQGSLIFIDSNTVLSIFSSLSTPAILKTSSVCSSWMTSMISSIVIIPSKTFFLFITGITFKSYFEASSATSSWSVSGSTEMKFVFVISSNFVESGEINISLKFAIPMIFYCH